MTEHLERLPVPPDEELQEQARNSPGGWAYEIDWDYGDDQEVPPEAIKGAWKVSNDGTLTGEYMANSRYRPVVNSDREAPPYMHASAAHSQAEWLGEIDQRAADAFPDVPVSMLRGWWYVDEKGALTTLFRANSLYDPRHWEDAG